MNYVESKIQQTIVAGVRMMPGGELLFHVPNGFKIQGTPTQRRARGARWKREGLLPGVPDLFLPVARDGWHGLFIEVKDPDTGRLSTAQRDFIEDVKPNGFLTLVIDNAQDGIDLISEYLKGGKW